MVAKPAALRVRLQCRAMSLIFAAIFCTLAGMFVALNSQEPRVKKWFVLLCLSAAALTLGLWLEINSEEYAYLAARINMTAGLVLATSGLVSARIMCGLPIHRPVLILLGTAALVNVATVWLTEAYFTGDLIRYAWGIYVGGDPKFIFNPLLVLAIALYGLVNLGMNYRQAHPFDKNRAKYLLMAYSVLALSFVDYVPHFGVDLFGGPVSGVTIPLFLLTFGYTTLRYRLLDFRSAMGQASGWVLSLLAAGAIYAAAVSVAPHWLGIIGSEAQFSAALVALLTAMTLSRVLPRMTGRVFSRRETNYGELVQGAAGELSAILDEGRLLTRALDICTGPFGSLSAHFVPGVELAGFSGLLEQPVVELEVHRRLHATGATVALPGPRDAEILVPLVQQ